MGKDQARARGPGPELVLNIWFLADLNTSTPTPPENLGCGRLRHKKDAQKNVLTNDLGTVGQGLHFQSNTLGVHASLYVPSFPESQSYVLRIATVLTTR